MARISGLIENGEALETGKVIYGIECFGLPYEVISNDEVVAVELPVVEADLAALAPEYLPRVHDFKLRQAMCLVEQATKTPLIIFIRGELRDLQAGPGNGNSQREVTCLINPRGKPVMLHANNNRELVNFDQAPWPGYHPHRHLQGFESGKETILIENQQDQVIVSIQDIQR